jgi:hypothetical protein
MKIEVKEKAKRSKANEVLMKRWKNEAVRKRRTGKRATRRTHNLLLINKHVLLLFNFLMTRTGVLLS